MRFYLSFWLFLLFAGPAFAGPVWYGFAGVACGVDDPHDATGRTDYSNEVAGFTNLNQVCPMGDVATSAAILAAAAAAYTPLYAVEPFLFDGTAGRLRPLPTPRLDLLAQIIDSSGVDPAKMMFYLVDEPSLRGLPARAAEQAAALLRATWPDTPIMLIEAWEKGRVPPIPPSVTYWGFDLYALRDPAGDDRFMTHLENAAGALGPGQRMVLVMDAQYTSAHAAAGLSESDMAEVAGAYAALAAARPDVAALLGYAWPGGIDRPSALGARDLPGAVRQAYRQIGKAILGSIP